MERSGKNSKSSTRAHARYEYLAGSVNADFLASRITPNAHSTGTAEDCAIRSLSCWRAASRGAILYTWALLVIVIVIVAVVIV